MHGVNLVPDVTLFLQLGIFLLCFFVLKTLVFTPYLDLLAKRREKTQGLLEKAQKSAEEAAALKAKYDSFMNEERSKVAQWVDGERRKISEEEREIIQAARDKSKKELDAKRAQLNKEAEEARKNLQPLAKEFASAITKKIIPEGKEVSMDSFSLRPKPEPMKAMRSS